MAHASFLLLCLFVLFAAGCSGPGGKDDAAIRTVEKWKEGVRLVDEKRPVDAIPFFREALEIEPTNHNARFDLVRILMWIAGNHGNARRSFSAQAADLRKGGKENEAKEAEDNATQHRGAQWQLLTESGDHLRFLRTAWPHVWQIPWLQSYIYLEFEDYDRARESLVAAMKLHPPDAAQRAKFEEAIKVVEQAKVDKELGEEKP